MTSDYGDPIGAALHAEAEDARGEMRAAGIACPSCGVNMADLPEVPGRSASRSQCPRRQALVFASVDMFRAAANVGLYDEMRNNIWEIWTSQRASSTRHGAKRDDRVPGRAG